MAGPSLTEQQIRSLAEAAWTLRWRIAQDMNGDGALTISDVLAWCKWLFFAPGDYLLLVTMMEWTQVAAFFEMDTSMLPGWAAGFLSVFAVPICIGMAIGLCWVLGLLLGLGLLILFYGVIVPFAMVCQWYDRRQR
jgi:hypothetical protein